MTEWLVDSSHWQQGLDMERVVGLGAAGAICKSSEGQYSSDGSFAYNMQQLHKANGLAGAYHFARPSQSSGESQAKRAVEFADGEGATLLALDIETTGGLSSISLRAWCRDFLDYARANHKGAVVSYCSQSYARAMDDVLFADGIGRWIASPGYKPYLSFDLWQSNWYATVVGTHPVDVNTWEGDLDSLKTWFGHVDPPVVTPPPVIVPPTPPVVVADPVFKDNLITVHTAGFNRIVAAANGADHTTAGARQIVRAVFGALAHLGHGSHHSVMVTDGIVTAESKKFALLVLRQWQTHLGHPATGVLTNSELIAVGSAAPGHRFHVRP